MRCVLLPIIRMSSERESSDCPSARRCVAVKHRLDKKKLAIRVNTNDKTGKTAQDGLD